MGPITRGVTYAAIFGGGYGLALGPVFGLTTGIAHGITLGWEFSRAARNAPPQGFWLDVTASAIRGCGFGLGAAYTQGAVFGIAFAILSTAGQVVAYRFGIRPTLDYRPAARPRLTKIQVLAVINRTAGYAAAGYVCALIAHEDKEAWSVGLRSGLTIGVVTAVVNVFTPFIEWSADRVPEKRMGVFGIGLVLVGFGLQSLQYWVAFLDIGVR